MHRQKEPTDPYEDEEKSQLASDRQMCLQQGDPARPLLRAQYLSTPPWLGLVSLITGPRSFQPSVSLDPRLLCPSTNVIGTNLAIGHHGVLASNSCVLLGKPGGR